MKKLVRAGSEKKLMEEGKKIDSDSNKVIIYKKYIPKEARKKMKRIIA